MTNTKIEQSVAVPGQGWRTTARRLLALGLVAIGAAWFFDRMLLVAAVVATNGALAVGCLVLARRARKRGEVISVLVDFLAAQTKSVFTVSKPRWAGLTLSQLALTYAPNFNDADLELRRKVEHLVDHRLDGHYAADWARGKAHSRVVFRRLDAAPVEKVVDPTDPVVRTEQVIGTQFPAGASIEDAVRDPDTGMLVSFKIRYPAMARDMSPQFRGRVLHELNNKTPGGPFRARWDFLADQVFVDLAVRLPERVEYDIATAMEFLRAGVLPVAITEAGAIGWNTDRDTGTPHALFSGTSGSGKTSLMRAAVIGALLLHWRVLACDPKETEFVGFEDFPGVDAVGTTIAKMLAIINAVYIEMLRRNKVIKRAKRAKKIPPGFESILLVVDEFIDFKERLDMLWAKMRAEDKNLKGKEHPVLTRLRLLGVKARSVDIHLLFGSQRPDVEFISGPMRDQMRFRASLMALDQQGSRMMWERHASLAADLPNIKGRCLISDALGQPTESQAFWVPDPGNYPLLSDVERAFIDHVTELLHELHDRVPLVDLSTVVDDDEDDDDDIDADREIAAMDAVARLRGGEDETGAGTVTPDTKPVAAADVDPGMRVIVPGPDGDEVQVEVINVEDDNGTLIEISYVTVDTGEEGTYSVDRRDSVEAVLEPLPA